MCDGGAIAMGIISVMSSAMSAKSNNRAMEAQADAAAAAAENDMLAMVDQQSQINEGARQEKFERMRQAMRDQATLRVAQGEAGVAGLTPLRSLHDSMTQAQYDIGTMEYNRQNAIKQTERGMSSIQATAEGRINEAKAKSTGNLAAGLQIGMAGAQGAVAGYKLSQTIKSAKASGT